MENVLKMRRYRTAELSSSQFIPSTTPQNILFATDDLAKSGLTMDDMEVDVGGALYKLDKASACYNIPYFDLQGRPLVDADQRLTMYRTKMGYPNGLNGQKYSSPSAEILAKHGLPTSIPYIPPAIHGMDSNELIIAEGEKKTASIVKILSLPAIGIGGCQMWRDPDGSGAVHPWTLELLRARKVSQVTIVPDGDILRYDICTAYGTLARALERAGFAVRIIKSNDKIDDLLVRWGKAARDNFMALGVLEPDNLVQSSKSLISSYNLAFKTDAKGAPTVHQHTSNIMRLMEEHPAFPKIWLDTDNNIIMMGDEKVEPNKTDMGVANYFQYNFGFDKVTDRVIHNCILSLARGNRRSPFLDWIIAQKWDGVHRLATWLERHWGVDSSNYTQEIARKWLVSSCARLDKPGTKLDWMMIVVGPQGIGKTTMPEIIFRKELVRTLYGEQNDKDLHMLMHSALCVGFDELDSFGKKESSTLKAMITRSEDAFRPPYGATIEVFPRRFTLYGCGNRYEFLQHDLSGYRRYAVVEATRLLDFAGLEADRKQLWAEAWYEYNNGSLEYWKIDNASDEAEKYAVPNVFEEKVRSWISAEKLSRKTTAVKDGLLYFTIGQILSALEEPDHRAKELAGILRAIPNIEYPKFAITGPLGGDKRRWYRIAIES